MANLNDAQLTAVLDNAVAVINPVLDALADRDPLGIKEHTFDDDTHNSSLEKIQHAAAKLANAADWPGTKGWTERSMNERAEWWVNRIGTLNTAVVAFPGLLGAWAKTLPVSSYLGFANQAMVLVAIAREYGVTDRDQQVRLLASVLCGRELTTPEATPKVPATEEPKKRGRSLIRAVWDAAQILRGLDEQVDRRPRPMKPFRLLSYLPVVGAPATYIGERLALSTAAKRGRKWIAHHPDAITS